MWYDLGKKEPYGFLHPMIHNDRQLIAINPSFCFVDHNLFEIQPKEQKYIKPLAAFAISTVSVLMKELGGRANLGEGALKTEGIDIEKLLFINPRKSSDNLLKKLHDWIDRNDKFIHRSIFEDIGATSGNDVILKNVNPSRRELDKIVMEEFLGLTDEEQLDVYRAVVDIVKSRLEKAKSLGKGKKMKEGIDVDALVKVIMENIGSETLGTFYKSEITPQKPLITKTLPRNTEDARIVQELFDWYIYLGNKKVKCNSELEARYLKVWAEAGIEQIKIPKDEKALKIIVPKLEKLKSSLDKVVQSHLNSILDRKTRDKIAHFVWAELVK